MTNDNIDALKAQHLNDVLGMVHDSLKRHYRSTDAEVAQEVERRQQALRDAFNDVWEAACGSKEAIMYTKDFARVWFERGARAQAGVEGGAL